MANLGRQILGTYSASCEELRRKCPSIKVPQVGCLVFFASTDKSTAIHVGLVYKVSSSTIYTVEGNTSGQPGLITNGTCVATKSYSKVSTRILSYSLPKYTEANPSKKVIDIAIQEVGYQGKKSNKQLNVKSAEGGTGTFTKYGKWINANGASWSGSFISWCFSAAYDSSFNGVIGNFVSDQSTIKSNFVNQSNSNSSLASYVNRLTIGQQGIRSTAIQAITIHSAKAVGSIYDLAVMLNSSDKCYNYGIDNSGTIGLFADEISWTNSSNSHENDSRSINIICMNETLEPNYSISKQCYEALVNLCEDICRRNFIFILNFTDNPTIDSITFHDQFNSKSNCPGPYIKETIISKLIEDVNERIGAQINPKTGSVTIKSKLASSQLEAIKAQSTIAVKSIKPYVIQPNSSMLGIDYSRLKQLGVVGVMIDAGERYDVKHNLANFRTENVYKQTEEALNDNMPHSYIYTTHARSIEEVKEEAYWFYFIVSKYPPKLGVWLHCKFDVNSQTAQTLVDEWYKYFVKWGFKSKCGIYATKSQSSLIGWPKQCAYMPLWLENELVTTVCPDDEILTPSFFKLDDLTNKSGLITDISAASEESNLGLQGAISAMGGNVAELVADLRERYALTTDSEKSVSKADRLRAVAHEDIILPKAESYIGRKGWMRLASILKQDSLSYLITHLDSTVTDNDGLCVLDGRYLIGVGNGISSTAGTYVDLILENGTIIECIVGNILPNSKTDSTNHIYEMVDQTTSWSCGQFIVVNKSGIFNSEMRKSKDCSIKSPNWQSPVKTVKVYNTNWFA